MIASCTRWTVYPATTRRQFLGSQFPDGKLSGNRSKNCVPANAFPCSMANTTARLRSVEVRSPMSLSAKYPSEYGQGRRAGTSRVGMACAVLGSDSISGGGMDLQFPNHETKSTQSEGASGKPFATSCAQTFFECRQRNLSKSPRNFFTSALVKRYDGRRCAFHCSRPYSLSLRDANPTIASSLLS